MSGERIETAGEYTPTTDCVRDVYVARTQGGAPGARLDVRVIAAEFDRWFAQVTAEAEARGAREADAALTKALGQRDAVAVTAERMTSYARQAEAVLREIAALHGRYFDIEKGPGDYEASPEPEDIWRFDRDLRAILARAEQTGADR